MTRSANAERRREQAAEARAQDRQGRERVREQSAPPLMPSAVRCPARLIPARHVFWTSRQDGHRRCLFCCRWECPVCGALVPAEDRVAHRHG